MGKKIEKTKDVVKTVTAVASTIAAIGGIIGKAFTSDKK